MLGLFLKSSRQKTVFALLFGALLLGGAILALSGQA